MATLRSLVYIVIGIIVGAVIALGGVYIFAKGASGQVLLRDFLIAQNKTLPAAQGPAATSTSAAASSTPPGTLLVPKSFATEDYFTAINNVIQDVFAINAANAQLGPLLDTLERQTLSCTYLGFYETMNEAHQLADKNQTLISQLGFHLSALAAANTQTKDAITKTDTQALVTAGTALTGSLQAYAAAVNGLLAGDTPTSAQIAEFQSLVNVATGASQSFANALQPLLEHIVAADQQLSATSTPAQ